MKSIFFYFILFFGALLLAYVGFSFQKYKRKISLSENDKVDIVKHRLSSFWKRWMYYFTDGKEKNLIRNIILAVGGLVIFLYLNSIMFKFSTSVLVVIYLLLFFIGVWRHGKKKALKAFEIGFPEVIQVLNAATTSGSGLLQALERCGTDVEGPIGEEFKQIHKRLGLGEDVRAVFEDAYSRWPYKEFYAFIIIVRINLEKGGQMKEVIQRLARILADNRKMEQKKRTMTSEARMSAGIVAAIPLFFFIFMKFMMPENFRFITEDPTGKYVLYFVLGSELFGLGIIQWLMNRATK